MADDGLKRRTGERRDDNKVFDMAVEWRRGIAVVKLYMDDDDGRTKQEEEMRYMQQYNEVELSALGMGHCGFALYIFPIKMWFLLDLLLVLNRNSLMYKTCSDKWFCCFIPWLTYASSFYLVTFMQIEILLGKSDKFDELMAAAAEEKAAHEAEEQS